LHAAAPRPTISGLVLLDRRGINVVQIVCGDPHHAAWEEGDRLPEKGRAVGCGRFP
jgi:hypothetical protein